MCGIFLASTVEKVNHVLFTKALSLLNHRGPDETSIHSETPHLYFGFKRLSIIGINDGVQPFFSPSKDIVAIINGEFYDYQIIKDDFLSSGYSFKGSSDCEIIIPMFLKYGLDCFSMLNGEYAGIIYDKRNNTIYAFRDRHGIKPLYMSFDDKGILISSEIKTILGYRNENPEYNTEYLKQKLFIIPQDQDETLFKNISHIMPGNYIKYDVSTNTLLAQKKYWQVNYSSKNYLKMSLTDILDSFRHKLYNSIQKRLIADVPVACYLSGGIDSSVCYGIASSLNGKGLDAFTISFSDKKYDEQLLSKKLVDKYNGKQYILDIDEELLQKNFADHLWYLEDLAYTSSGVAKHLLSKLAHENGYKVVLTGEGSDEYNCGYISSMIDAAKIFKSMDNNILKNMISSYDGALISPEAQDLQVVNEILGFNPTFISNAVPHIKFMNNLLHDNIIEDRPLKNIEKYLLKYPLSYEDWNPLNIALYLQSITAFSYIFTVVGDRAEMAHSIEARLPFLDNTLIEFISQIPAHYKCFNNQDKFILRESCKDYVTKEHFEMKKHAYETPPLNKDGPFVNMMLDEFSSVSFINKHIFNHKKLLQVLYDARKSDILPPHLSRNLFLALSLAVIDKTFSFK
ncbi:MAG: asnB [Burkholderiales bacterium]|jgi:asparagine synthase (glutamine-hydrolysing)|nr:asnB [Burkholderiales bacterium]